RRRRRRPSRSWRGPDKPRGGPGRRRWPPPRRSRSPRTGPPRLATPPGAPPAPPPSPSLPTGRAASASLVSPPPRPPPPPPLPPSAALTLRGTASGNDPAAGPVARVVSPDGIKLVVDQPQAFTVTGVDAFGNSLGDLTAVAVFSIDPEGSCVGNVCTLTKPGN